MIILPFFLFIICACSLTDSSKKDANEKLKSKTIVFSDLKGNDVALTDFKGKKVLVNYWATWCRPCVNEMPDLLKAQKILAKENYVFLLVSDESIDKITKFKTFRKYNFKFLKAKKTMASIGVYALPTTFIYNEKGKKVEEIIGATIWNSLEMITLLKNIK